MPKLTDRFISTFRPADGAKDRLAFDTECRGLGVRSTASGNRTFLVQWTDPATGKKVREPLGAWGSLTVDQARGAARVRLGKVAQGIDPKAERQKAKAEEIRRKQDEARAKTDARFTLETLIDEWGRLYLSGKRLSYASEAQRALRLAFNDRLKAPASSIARPDVLGVLDALASQGKAPIAGRVLAYGRACYGWAVKRGKLPLNPFEGLPSIAGSAPSRDRVLTDAEVGSIWRASERLGFPFAPIFRLLLLTAQRREEVAAMRWSELSADLGTWTLPRDRAKNGRAHVVHLSEPARAVLGTVERIDRQDLVFSTTGKTAPSGFSKAKNALVAAMAEGDCKAAPIAPNGQSAAWRLHDFRRTAVTWLAGAGFPPHIADRILNHVTGSIQGVAAIYQRHDFLSERKSALDAWAAHVMACATAHEPAHNIIPLRAGR